MVDYIAMIINAAFTGIGVALGNEIYTWFKERRGRIKEKLIKNESSKKVID
jgi:hypothetical protein